VHGFWQLILPSSESEESSTNRRLQQWWIVTSNVRKTLISSEGSTYEYILTQTGTTLASLYGNRATREAFRFLFQEFFDAILRITGKPLEIAVFHQNARLLNFMFDGEAAQMQGCGDIMLTWNDPALSGITTKDPLQLVQYVAKTCVTHFCRHVNIILHFYFVADQYWRTETLMSYQRTYHAMLSTA